MSVALTEPVDLLPGYQIEESTGALLSAPWPTQPSAMLSLARLSLGPAVIEWSEGRTNEPGLIDYMTGEPWRWTVGQKRWLILWYQVDHHGRFVYRSGVKRGAKGVGKDPTAAAWLNCELLGPVRMAGWSDQGEPYGERHMLPLVQVASNSEAQSKDVLRVASAMWSAEARDYYGLDCGETRTTVPGGGRFEILTASEKSSEGDPATAIALNESHHMVASSGGHRIAEVARRNVGKSPAHVQARLHEFTNAHQQGSDSVAERSYEAWQAQVSGGTFGKQDILYDSREAQPAIDLSDTETRMAALRASYADAPWADLERLSDEMLDPRTSVGDSIRYYLNGLAAAEDAWVDPGAFDAGARVETTVADNEQVSLFLDCSKSGDATGLVGCRLSDGFQFVLGVWQQPHGDRGKGWLAPREQVDATVRAALDRFSVVWLGIDPSPATDDADESLYWSQMIERLHRDYRTTLPIWATPGVKGSAVLFDMRLSQAGGVERNRIFTEMAARTAQEIDDEGTLTHDGNPALRVHVHNARRRPNQWGMTLGKQTRSSKKLVDLAVCMVGARLGRKIALDSGKVRKPSTSKQRIIVLS